MLKCVGHQHSCLSALLSIACCLDEFCWVWTTNKLLTPSTNYGSTETPITIRTSHFLDSINCRQASLYTVMDDIQVVCRWNPNTLTSNNCNLFTIQCIGLIAGFIDFQWTELHNGFIFLPLDSVYRRYELCSFDSFCIINQVRWF